MKTVLIFVACVISIPIAFFVSFVWSEISRDSQLASLEVHTGLSEVLTQPGTYDPVKVFGGDVEKICTLAAYASEPDLQQSLSKRTRDAIASAPPSEDLSWRLLTLGPGESRWFVLNEIAGASLANRAACFEVTSELKIVVQQSTNSGSNSLRIVRFIP